MSTERYQFIRDSSTIGFLSGNRASTDSLRAVNKWANGANGRSYVVQIDEDDKLIVDLKWNDVDRAAGADLDQSCVTVGVARFHIPKAPHE
jgi:hypothetical protein